MASSSSAATDAAASAAPPASQGPATAAPAPPAPSAPRQRAPGHPTGKRLAILSLSALGVVYGDIGTSVLYAIKECFGAAYGVAPTPRNVYGVLSLIFWALTLVVSVKYIYFIMRADNRGEGGVLALLALIHRKRDPRKRSAGYGALVALGLFGSALLYGDGVITPAISILGAMEGLVVGAPVLEPLIVPATVAIIVALFWFQERGTARVGVVFGPITLLWFLSIGIFGALEIVREPEILLAVNPWLGVRFFLENGTQGFVILGAVVLVITGAEALYADMGHFGRRPIRLAWYAVVFPALLLNYFGQGGLLLRDPSAADNPFYRLVPAPLLYPMVAVATAAAVIASQALISGAFSLTRQALQLGYCPRVTITHTSAREAGQIYIKEVNWALMLLCIALVVAYGSSSALAGMYGVAVTGTMTITTLLFYWIARVRFRWSAAKAGLFAFVFLVVDLAFLSANLIKITHGGWFPLVVAGVIYIMMTTWQRGREVVRELLHSASLPVELFLEDVARRQPPRVPGTAVFMTSDTEGAPVVLLHHVKHNKLLHEQVILLSVLSVEVPEVPPAERVKVEPLGQGFYRIIARYGFMQTPNVPEVMACCEPLGLKTRPAETSYFLGRERLISTGGTRLARWRKKLFAFMSRNARSATEYFGIPPNRVVELGAQIEF